MKEKIQKNSTPTDFQHKKSLGQNFLTSDVVPKWLVQASNLQPDEIVLEIGPGVGALTKVLLENGAKVIALEADPRAITILEKQFAKAISNKRLTIYHKDARQLNLTELNLHDKQFKVVANVPYYLSGFLLRKLLDSKIQPKTLVFLLQKELVTRIARSKKESLLSLSVKVFGTPNYIKTIGRGHFHPIPKVDSAILQVTNISNDRLKTITNEHFFKILHLGFKSKRKQLLGNLCQIYKREEVLSVFSALKLSSTIRGEDLPLDDWLELTQLLKPFD